jgi:DUF1680 family protein
MPPGTDEKRVYNIFTPFPYFHAVVRVQNPIFAGINQLNTYPMKYILFLTALAAVISCGEAREDGAFADIVEVPFTDVRLADNFWAQRIETNRTVSIPSAFHQCEINGRFDNFAIAGGLMEGEHRGDFSFDDTDPYKIIEGASYSLAVQYDAALDAYLDSVITLIAAAQEEDGYLTTCVTNNCTRLSGWWGSSRWEKINSHELYNSGHLYEAAVAHYRATGKRSLLDVATRNADLVCRTFGLDEGQIMYPSGHPIIEMALVKLYRVTGDRKYLDRARYFVEEAGRLSNGRKPGIYSQDHKPVAEQDEIVGHAVRAGYFYSGVADVARADRDTALLHAAERVWKNMAGRKLYITGGIGSRPQGEGFGPDFELNNFGNYCETCASIANVYWNYRMFLATGEAKYIDVLERALYNGVVAGVSLGGDRFFYDNPLCSAGGHEREEWFGCACCPGNVTRFMPSVPGYVYAAGDSSIYVNLYATNDARIRLGDDTVGISQRTEYPWDNYVGIHVNPPSARRFKLKVRIPGWSRLEPVPSRLYSYVDSLIPDVRMDVNSKYTKAVYDRGYLVIDREWSPGDTVNLFLDMPIHKVRAADEVRYDRGLLAIERGPIVYALESADQEDDYLFDIAIPRGGNYKLVLNEGLLGGIVTVEGDALKIGRDAETGELTETPFRFKAVPYGVWNNRGDGQMVVWTPETKERATVRPKPTIASRAVAVGGDGYNDLFEPTASDDINTPYHYWWLKAGTEETAGYRFDRPQKVSAVEVYWLAFDHYDVSYRAPSSWILMYLDGDDWKEVPNPSHYGTETDMYNRVAFDPVTTRELKIAARLRAADPLPDGTASTDINASSRKGFSGGIIEWKVYE